MRHLPALLGAWLALTQPAVLGSSDAERNWTILPHAGAVDESYDYIIVGGGTAGLTVADRLTEDGKTSVLVIEFGEQSDAARISTVQGGFQGLDQQFLYNVISVPQVNLKNKTTSVLIGKVLGGSSAINAMMTLRGTTEDYDRWGQFFSKSSEWSWKGMLPYFRKALNFVPPDAAVTKSSNITYDTSFWGNSSGVYAGWPSFQYPVTKLYIDAWRGMPGVEFPPDSGSGKPGVFWFPTFMDPKKVVRSYARTGHYSNYNRTNYQVITGSKVDKIILDGTTATGVTFVPANSKNATASKTPTKVTAKKEVILAAGGIHTPQIMQLSGLGPKKVLDAAKITTVVDLPGVGQNFQDHPMLQAMYTLTNLNVHPTDGDLYGNATFRDWSSKAWSANRTGPNSIATGNAAAWLPYPVISPRSAEVSAKLAAQDPAISLPPGTDPTVVAGYKAQMASYAEGLKSNGTAFYNLVTTGGSASGILVLLHPLSRGTVNVDPSDPAGKEPIVDYRALSNPLEATIMTDMMRYTRRYYMNNTAMAPYAPAESQPGDAVVTDADFKNYIVNSLSPTEYHPVGTCAMMPRELGGVVDEQLRVYGVKNLRIVDGSIMPTLPGGNTCQTVYAVAEKAADLIKASAAQ